MDQHSFLKTAKTELSLHLHPSRCNVVKVGILEELNDLLLKYNENVEGILLGYSDLVIHCNKGSILIGSNPYIRLKMSAQLLLFAPPVGSTLDGVVHQTGTNYVHILVLGMFNAAIRGNNLSDHFYPDEKQWLNPVHYSKEHIDYEIKVGSKIRFTVVGLEVESHKPYTIEAAVSAEGTGCSDWLNRQKAGGGLDMTAETDSQEKDKTEEGAIVAVEKLASEAHASKKRKKMNKTELEYSGGRTETVRSDDMGIADLLSPPGKKGAREGGEISLVASSRQETGNGGGGGDKQVEDEIKEPKSHNSDRGLGNGSSIPENTPRAKKRKKRKDEENNSLQEVGGSLGKTASDGTGVRVPQTDGLVGSKKTKKRRKST